MKSLSINEQLNNEVVIELPKSKSIANRLLIAQALSKSDIQIGELPDSEDTRVLLKALKSDSKEQNIGIAGTAMRFLTAYYAIQKGRSVHLTGDTRMKERPIAILVDKLKELGAVINYQGNEGFPPLSIHGKELYGGECSINASVSSQYISALLLIAPYLEKGLLLKLTGRTVSSPYIKMTLLLQQKLGIDINEDGNKLFIKKGAYTLSKKIEIERDWSAAAFFYEFVALSGQSILLNELEEKSIQGDSVVTDLFTKLGVKTTFTEEGALLEKIDVQRTNYLELDLLETPDLAQSIAVTAGILIDKTKIKGLSTLRIKETNRVLALQNELKKINVLVEDIDGDTVIVHRYKEKINEVVFDCYDDHRMAMSLAPLVTHVGCVKINTPDVVKKSFPKFWDEVKKLGIEIN